MDSIVFESVKNLRVSTRDDEEKGFQAALTFTVSGSTGPDLVARLLREHGGRPNVNITVWSAQPRLFDAVDKTPGDPAPGEESPE